MAMRFWPALATVSAGAFGLAVATFYGSGGDSVSARSLVVGSGAMLASTLIGGAQAAYIDRREARAQAEKPPVVSIHRPRRH